VTIIIPANSAADTAYDVANSCRFETNAYMGRTPGTASGDGTKATFSCWIKPSFIPGSDTALLTIRNSSTTSMFNVGWSGGGLWVGVLDNASYAGSISTTRVYRDQSAWMHICVTYDTTQATSTDRIKININGIRETDLTYTTFPSEDHANGALTATTGYTQQLCSYTFGGGSYFYGYIAEAVFCEGQALAATSFGEFDSTSPTIWKPIDVSELTFGDQGFYLDFEDSDNLGDDESGNTNDLTEYNLAAVDQCTDTPTNNFCTGNPLDNYFAATTFSEGNCKLVTNAGNTTFNTGTVGLTAGKWYWETKITTLNTTGSHIGVTSLISSATNNQLGATSEGYSYYPNGQKFNNNSKADYGDSYTAGDIIGIALDLDNLKIYWSKNGTFQDSGDPTTGATGTGAAYTVTAVASTTAGAYFPAWGEDGGSADTFEINFGNPSYANSSDAADANGYGAFEYAPPSGYLAVCTKNLGSDGG
jgi:hypothetical protein